jgi:hypothetical protein
MVNKYQTPEEAESASPYAQVTPPGHMEGASPSRWELQNQQVSGASNPADTTSAAITAGQYAQTPLQMQQYAQVQEQRALQQQQQQRQQQAVVAARASELMRSAGYNVATGQQMYDAILGITPSTSNLGIPIASDPNTGYGIVTEAYRRGEWINPFVMDVAEREGYVWRGDEKIAARSDRESGWRTVPLTPAGTQPVMKYFGWEDATRQEFVPSSVSTVPVRSRETMPLSISGREAERFPTTTFFTPYDGQTAVEEVKIGYNDFGVVGAYQKNYHGQLLLVSSGSRAALQSGMFSFGQPLDPRVWTQESAGTKLSIKYANIPLAMEVLANPKLYSGVGAEAYGGFGGILLDNRTIESSKAQLSTYANPFNLANLVSPQAVNLPKSEQVANEYFPWGNAIRESTPTIFRMDAGVISEGRLPAAMAAVLPGVVNALTDTGRKAASPVAPSGIPGVFFTGQVEKGFSKGISPTDINQYLLPEDWVSSPKSNWGGSAPPRNQLIEGGERMVQLYGMGIDRIIGFIPEAPQPFKEQNLRTGLGASPKFYTDDVSYRERVIEEYTRGSAGLEAESESLITEINASNRISDAFNIEGAGITGEENALKTIYAQNVNVRGEWITDNPLLFASYKTRSEALQARATDFSARYNAASGGFDQLGLDVAAFDKKVSNVKMLFGRIDEAEQRGLKSGAFVIQEGRVVPNIELERPYGALSDYGAELSRFMLNARGETAGTWEAKSVKRTAAFGTYTGWQAKGATLDNAIFGAQKEFIMHPEDVGGSLMAGVQLGMLSYGVSGIVAARAAASTAITPVAQAAPSLFRQAASIGLNYGIPAAFLGSFLWSASEGGTASPVRTQMNVGAGGVHLAAMVYGSAMVPTVIDASRMDVNLGVTRNTAGYRTISAAIRDTGTNEFAMFSGNVRRGGVAYRAPAGGMPNLYTLWDRGIPTARTPTSTGWYQPGGNPLLPPGGGGKGGGGWTPPPSPYGGVALSQKAIDNYNMAWGGDQGIVSKGLSPKAISNYNLAWGGDQGIAVPSNPIRMMGRVDSVGKSVLFSGIVSTAPTFALLGSIKPAGLLLEGTQTRSIIPMGSGSAPLQLAGVTKMYLLKAAPLKLAWSGKYTKGGRANFSDVIQLPAPQKMYRPAEAIAKVEWFESSIAREPVEYASLHDYFTGDLEAVYTSNEVFTVRMNREQHAEAKRMAHKKAMTSTHNHPFPKDSSYGSRLGSAFSSNDLLFTEDKNLMENRVISGTGRVVYTVMAKIPGVSIAAPSRASYGAIQKGVKKDLILEKIKHLPGEKYRDTLIRVTNERLAAGKKGKRPEYIFTTIVKGKENLAQKFYMQKYGTSEVRPFDAKTVGEIEKIINWKIVTPEILRVAKSPKEKKVDNAKKAREAKKKYNTYTNLGLQEEVKSKKWETKEDFVLWNKWNKGQIGTVVDFLKQFGEREPLYGQHQYRLNQGLPTPKVQIWKRPPKVKEDIPDWSTFVAEQKLPVPKEINWEAARGKQKPANWKQMSKAEQIAWTKQKYGWQDVGEQKGFLEVYGEQEQMLSPDKIGITTLWMEGKPSVYRPAPYIPVDEIYKMKSGNLVERIKGTHERSLKKLAAKTLEHEIKISDWGIGRRWDIAASAKKMAYNAVQTWEGNTYNELIIDRTPSGELVSVGAIFPNSIDFDTGKKTTFLQFVSSRKPGGGKEFATVAELIAIESGNNIMELESLDYDATRQFWLDRGFVFKTDNKKSMVKFIEQSRWTTRPKPERITNPKEAIVRKMAEYENYPNLGMPEPKVRKVNRGQTQMIRIVKPIPEHQVIRGASDAYRYMEMEEMFNQPQLLLGTTKALTVPVTMFKIQGKITSLDYSPAGIVLTQTKLSGDSAMLAFKPLALGEDLSIPAWTTATKATIAVSNKQTINIDPFSGWGTIEERTVIERNPEIITGTKKKHGFMLFNLYNLPRIAPTVAGTNALPEINPSDILGINFIEGRVDAGVTRVVGRPSQAVLHKFEEFPGSFGGDKPIGVSRVTREGEMAIKDFLDNLESDHPTRINIMKYGAAPHRKMPQSILPYFEKGTIAQETAPIKTDILTLNIPKGATIKPSGDLQFDNLILSDSEKVSSKVSDMLGEIKRHVKPQKPFYNAKHAMESAKEVSAATIARNKANEAQQLENLMNMKQPIAGLKLYKSDPDYWRWNNTMWAIAKAKKHTLVMGNLNQEYIPPKARKILRVSPNTRIGSKSFKPAAKDRERGLAKVVGGIAGVGIYQYKPSQVGDELHRGMKVAPIPKSRTRNDLDQYIAPIPVSRTRILPLQITRPDVKTGSLRDVLPYQIPDVRPVTRTIVEPVFPPVYPPSYYTPTLPKIPPFGFPWLPGGSSTGGEGGRRHGKYPWREIIPLRWQLW